MLEVLQLLHAQSSVLPVYCGTYYIRNLDRDEPLPDLGQEIPNSNLIQPEWIWIAYNRYDDKPLAMLVACPMQGLVFIIRICAIKSSPKSLLIGLFRKSLEAMKARGYTRFTTFLSAERNEEIKLRRIINKAGGKVLGGSHFLVIGDTDLKGL